MYLYINGKLMLENEAMISPFDHGFLYGLGVFETFRIYDGHPFLLDDHFQRLKSSCGDLNIVLNFSKEELLQNLEQLLTLNKLTDAYVRLNVSAGEAPIGLQTSSFLHPTTIIFMKPLGVMSEEKGAEIVNIPRNTPEGAIRLKSHHYLNNILAKRELVDHSKEGIFLTKDQKVAEGIVSNVFWVKKGQVYTPSLSTGILNGVTRQFVIELSHKYRITINEGEFDQSDLFDAEEMFITNSIQEIVAISELNDHLFSQKREIVPLLQKLYRDYCTKRLFSKNGV